ncbi:MAG: hypothetical protein OJF49_003813 [Ktedonobacterales bacterium]|jgi:uncharacterized membrane protein|nr:MAG: hypothetical protein OJF49_003813 [Ktedonobacterales bacterium]
MNPQQYPQQPVAAPNRWGPTSIGMEAHVAAGLSYVSMIVLGPIIPIVFFFVEKNNRFVKFHAAQGILLSIAGAIFGFLWFFVYGALIAGSLAAAGSSTAAAASSAGLGFGALIVGCVAFIISIGFLVLWVMGMIAGFSGKWTKLPVIGGIAESWAGGPATPAF